jgi:hypothetical protein
MNDRYGVDPCAAASLSELASLLRLFGPEHGRFILDFPQEWFNGVRTHFQSATDLQRARLVELWVHHAKRSLLPTKTTYSPALTWPRNAANLLREARELIGPAGSTPPCRALEDVLVDPSALQDCRGGHIPRTPDAYSEAARPLLQISPKVVLIDPYFRLRYRAGGSMISRPSARHRRSLKALLSTAQSEGRVEVFRLMLSESEAIVGDDGVLNFEADLEELRREAGVTRIALEYDFLDAMHSLERHPRYLLGNGCGLRFDWGFDTMADDSTNHVEWVGGAALAPLLERFM